MSVHYTDREATGGMGCAAVVILLAIAAIAACVLFGIVGCVAGIIGGLA